ncbi:protein DpdD [Pseudomonas viridiflava]|uniref:protein DpdD n=1 Tax=Pseudomonas viridiflava TaxID=33069 RepID=UPI0013CE8E3D|nr:protein DpdD [Pseudomonas viridiflava]
MIGFHIEDSARLHDAIVSASGYGNLVDEVQSLCYLVAQSLTDPDFPGALVPTLTVDGSLQVYAVTRTITEWRRLNPILIAFCGPTITSYTGVPGALPIGGVIEDVIRSIAPSNIGILRLPADSKKRVAALRALQRSRETLARAPSAQRKAPLPTSWLLASFQDHLNVGRRAAAWDTLNRLRDELRVDALNLKFLEVQLLAAFEDWSAILNMAGFASLCIARRPPAVTTLLLEALYRVYIQEHFLSGDVEETRRHYAELCRIHAKSMLVVPYPAMLTPGGWRIYALEALLSPENHELVNVVIEQSLVLGWISEYLPGSSTTKATEVSRVLQTQLNHARKALTEVDCVNSLDAVATAIASINRLSSAELAQLSSAEPFRTLLRTVSDVGGLGGLPSSWLEWLRKVSDPDFSNALEIARQGKDEWVLDESIADPVAVQRFVSALEAVQHDQIAAERTANALPFIVAWLQRDAVFPRSEMGPVYSILLTLFAMGASRGRGIYESSHILIHGLLAIGVTESVYRGLIADTEELAGSGFGVEMVYWLLEVIEDFIRFGAPDANAREIFLHCVLSKIAPIYSRLSSLQCAAIVRLAEQLGWRLDDIGVSKGSVAPDDFSSKMDGLRIAIYTLNESSSRQAKAALEVVSPNVIVDCNADHGGTDKLRSLAKNADLFVMTSLSAKHAATDCIREHRVNRPLLYAQGAGVSSILRVIEDYLKLGSA